MLVCDLYVVWDTVVDVHWYICVSIMILCIVL